MRNSTGIRSVRVIEIRRYTEGQQHQQHADPWRHLAHSASTLRLATLLAHLRT